MNIDLPELGVAPSGKRLRRKGRHGVFAGKTVWFMPERLEIYIVYKMALYKYASFPFLYTVSQTYDTAFACNNGWYK